jgi:RNA-directed DNA polymerase
MKASNAAGAKGLSCHGSQQRPTVEQEESVETTKPYQIPKEIIEEAWYRVKRADGGPGIDGQSIEEFEKDIANNLYKLWNRLSSGSYHSQPVKLVTIPKADGGERQLGIPTVMDRVAQMVVHLQLSPIVEEIFHQDSYGFRSGKSAHDAVKVCRERCFRHSWVIDLDIAKYFDTIEHDRLLGQVKKHTEERWHLLYIERWLKAPMERETGERVARERGTPQGGVISPLLANLYLHYAFDEWMKQNFPTIAFERYADDIVVHCVSYKQSLYVKAQIGKRLEAYGLSLHPQKTKVAYCRDSRRREYFPNVKFTFLGFDFKPRKARSPEGQLYTVFTPAVSQKNKTKMLGIIRTFHIESRSETSLEGLARDCKPAIQGWINYFKVYRKSELYSVLYRLNQRLVRWAKRKYRLGKRRAIHLLQRMAKENPNIFPHWEFGILP